MKNLGLVSIIIPTFNSEYTIRETVESILNQTYPYFEIIITDDSSSDTTISVIKSFKDSRIQLNELQKNKGAGIARNTSIRMARGKYIAFCDSDDLWTADKLEIQIKFMNEKKIAFSYSSYYIINENGEYLRTKNVSSKISFQSTLLKNEIGCLTAIYDQEMIGKRYMDEIRKRQDYLLWLKILKDIDIAEGIQAPLALYRVRQNSISRNKLGLLEYNYKVYRALNYTHLRSSLLLFRFLLNFIGNKIQQ